MKKVILISLVLFSIFAFPGVLTASEESDDHIGKFGIGVDINFYDEESGLSFYGGAHVRLRFSDRIGIEGAIQLRSISMETSGIDISSQPLSFSLLFFLLPRSIVGVYAFAGITFTKPNVEQSGSPGPSEIEGEWQNGIFGGIGIEIPISSALVLHGEIKYNDLDLSIIDLQVDYSGLDYSLGITFYF